ncbi:hypothetical protein KSNIM_04685, partial [Kitasatospora sp. DSM 101779]|nr:hypothetical protein [Kitasatospora sp. DSM 101779]
MKVTLLCAQESVLCGSTEPSAQSGPSSVRLPTGLAEAGRADEGGTDGDAEALCRGGADGGRDPEVGAGRASGAADGGAVLATALREGAG